MARIEVDPNYSSPTFSRATASTDLFKKEDVQNLAAAVSTHDHTAGKGALLVAGSIPAGSITSGMIADATIDTADLKDGAVTSAKIADGTIATADLADRAVTNGKLGPDTARANLLTNGGFELWQRGNGPFAATDVFTADRWKMVLHGTDTLSVSRDTSQPDRATGSIADAFCTYTKGTGTATRLEQTLQVSENQLRGRTISLSVRVQTPVANGIRISIGTNGTGGAATNSSYHSGSNAWETLTVTNTIPNDATVVFVYIFFAASGSFIVDSAMLVVGGASADYAPLHPADDLARCLRYYEVGVASIRWFSAATINPSELTYPVKAVKAVTPTITITPGTRTNIASATQRYASVQSVNWTYVPTVANLDTYALSEVFVLEANP